MIVNQNNISQLAWDKMHNLIPAIVQDENTGQLLMQGYMNPEALAQTLDSQLATFYSRSKQRLWCKGETSGNHLKVSQIIADCDNDSLLLKASPQGPACHTGAPTCWFEDTPAPLGFLAELENLLASRKQASADSSYTASLYQKGIKRISQKVGEEGVEVALAATSGDKEELLNESADLVYHLLVLLQANELELSQVIEVLKARQ